MERPTPRWHIPVLTGTQQGHRYVEFNAGEVGIFDHVSLIRRTRDVPSIPRVWWSVPAPPCSRLSRLRNHDRMVLAVCRKRIERSSV